MQAEQIAKALGNAKKSNGQWVCSCPVPTHGKGNGDRNPSLSVTIDDDNKPLFYCHGGCSQEQVFQTVKDMQLLPKLEERPDPLANVRPMPRLTVEQSWVYEDENRTAVFIKQRLMSQHGVKTYRLYKVDATGKQLPTLGDAKIVPYKLPELLDAKSAGRVIFVCEGEKASDALATLRVTATTSHAGAGHWPLACTEYFAGARVVILPDADLPGWRYARRVVEALLPVAKSIQVVDLGLPGLGDDAFEFVHELGGTREQLIEIVKAAPLVTDIEQVVTPAALVNDLGKSDGSGGVVDTDGVIDLASEFAGPVETVKPQQVPADNTKVEVVKVVKIEAWDDIEDEPVSWIIDGILPENSLSVLFGQPGSFKSFIALDIARAVAAGSDWMGRNVDKPGAVLYLCGEGFGGMGARIKALKVHHQVESGLPIYVIRHQLNLRSSQDDFDALIVAIAGLAESKGIEFKLMVIDTLARSFGGGNENDSDAMGTYISKLGALQEFLRCALLLLHHSGKDLAKGLRGHSSLLGAVDTQLEILKFEGDKRQGIITLTKQKDGEDGVRMGFEMVEVEIAESSLGFESVTSLAVKASEVGQIDQIDAKKRDAKGGASNAGHGPNQVLAIKCLQAAIKKHGLLKLIEGTQRMVVDIQHWRDEMWSQTGSMDEDKNTFKSAWRRAREDLSKHGHGQISDKLVWLTTKNESGDVF